MATNSLEQQALDRVARMYAGYDRHSQGAAPAPQDETRPHPAPDPPKAPAPPAPQPPKRPSGLLGALMEDKEQSLIMLLLVILMKDGADTDAVLALMYLLI